MKSIALALLLSLFLSPALAANNGKPDHATWLKQAARQQLRAGMVQEEVEAILGAASRTRFTKGPGGTTSELEYRSEDRKDWMNVFFLGGKLTNYSVARLGQGNAAQGQSVSQSPAAWAMVEPGMRPEEVKALLGEPTAKSYAQGAIGAPEAVTAWLYDITPDGTDPATGIVMLLDGKVLSVTSPLFDAN